jgi:hypothetical protein
MTTICKYIYHLIAAYILNLRASKHSREMGRGEPGANLKLKSVGARSNVHEDKAEHYLYQILNDPYVYSFYGALMMVIALAILAVIF